MKRASSSASEQIPKKRKVAVTTYRKWREDFDKELKTVSWLDCETEIESGKKMVKTLKCSVCTRFQSRIMHQRNFSDRWIVGADSIRTSNIRDHAHSEQHDHAMSLLKQASAKAEGKSCYSYAPIAMALSTLSSDEKERLRKKFDIAYFVAREKLSFRKYPAICELEAKHGIDLGTNYRTQTAGSSFVHYSAEAIREELGEKLRKAKFFSLLLDGSTDAGNVDNELVLVVWFDKDGTNEKVSTRTSHFKIMRPSTVTAQGMFDMLQELLQSLGIETIDSEKCTRLVGIGTDGASANIAGGGLKGLVEAKLPWMFWMWCLAHRLELAIKDALKTTYFDSVDGMLLNLYLLYSNLPKKCRQLEEVIADLKECLALVDGGSKPIRACGSRWIGHKWNAMKHVLARYGAYTNHLAAMSEDRSFKSTDRAKILGYYRQWTNAKYILGCAMFIDLLTPCVSLSKVMQQDNLDILAALTGLVKSVKELEKLESSPLQQWPTYVATVKKCSKEGENTIYQAQQLKNFDTAETYFENHHIEYCTLIKSNIKSRLAWSDLQCLRDIIFILATQGWQKALDENNSLEAVDRLVEKFAIPLEGAGADIAEIHAEFDAMLQYACQYISLSTLNYQGAWWRLFHAPVSTEWSNALTLVELLFSLPVSNGTLERVFSQVNVIKSTKRTQLSNQTLDDLLIVATSGVPLEEFNSNHAIDLWWKDKLRRPNQSPRAPYKKQQKVMAPSTSSDTRESEHVSDAELNSDAESDSLLQSWDSWIDIESDSDSEA